MRILLSTTSFHETPGDHHALLAAQGHEVEYRPGPLTEEVMLSLAGQFDGLLCGDDALTRQVLQAHSPRLKVISKYGIGVDKIDLPAAKELGIPVLFTPGVNHTTVAEHTFCLLLALCRNLVDSVNSTRQGGWKRTTGGELWSKKIGLVGLGRIGQEVAKRARGFEMEVHAYGNHWPKELAERLGIIRHETLEGLLGQADVVSLHTKLTASTRHMLAAKQFAAMKDGALLINTSRGDLVHTTDLLAALDSGRLAGYAADVMEQEPPPPDHPLPRHPKAIVTPHIGSRTFESVPRQAMKATRNLVNYLRGEGEVHHAY